MKRRCKIFIKDIVYTLLEYKILSGIKGRNRWSERMMKKTGVMCIVVLLLVSVLGVAVGITGGWSIEEEVRANDRDDVVEIHTWEDLHNMRDDLAGNYILMNDLGPEDAGYDEYASDQADGGAGWQPVGSGWGNRFTGSFDGQGYEISGLYIDRPNEDHIGLFGLIGYLGKVRDVGVVDAEIIGSEYVGPLAGVNYPGTVENSYATGSVTGDLNVGGLVGWNHEGTIENSYATGNVSGGARIAGLVGTNLEGTVSNSYATGSVSGTSDVLGGLVGWSDGRVENSYATGNVKGTSGALGGLVGLNYEGGTISNSYATGTMDGSAINVGGLVGSNYYATVNNSYATGNVNGTDHIGGLVGANWGPVLNSYATGEVSGNNSLGGLVGFNVEGTVSNSFWDVESSGIDISDGGTGRTTNQMMDITTFADADWDITAVADTEERDTGNTWNIVDTETYPFLSGKMPEEVVQEDDDGNGRLVWILLIVLIASLPVLLFLKKKKSGPDTTTDIEDDESPPLGYTTREYTKKPGMKRCPRCKEDAVTVMEDNSAFCEHCTHSTIDYSKWTDDQTKEI